MGLMTRSPVAGSADLAWGVLECVIDRVCVWQRHDFLDLLSHVYALQVVEFIACDGEEVVRHAVKVSDCGLRLV